MVEVGLADSMGMYFVPDQILLRVVIQCITPMHDKVGIFSLRIIFMQAVLHLLDSQDLVEKLQIPRHDNVRDGRMVLCIPLLD